jgi:hypothetical protein
MRYAVILGNKVIDTTRRTVKLAYPAEAQFIECDETVQRGWLYGNDLFIDPSYTPPSPPVPLTIRQLKQELDSIREREIEEYISQWGAISRQELWPLLERELVRIADDETPKETRYPTLVGFIKATDPEAEITPELLTATGLHLIEYRQAHSFTLRETEIRRNSLVEKYLTLAEQEQLDWDSASEWEGALRETEIRRNSSAEKYRAFTEREQLDGDSASEWGAAE